MQYTERHRRIDPQQSTWLDLQSRHRPIRFLDVIQNLAASPKIIGADFRQAQASRRAIKQPHPELVFQRRDILTDHRCRETKFASDFGKFSRVGYVTSPKGFGFDIEFDSDASADDLIRLVEAAKNGCFIDQTMAVANSVGHRLKIGNDWVDV